MEEVVVIIGAGPSGLATSACLNYLSVPNVILEREDCSGSLWKKHSYDRVKLHLAKEFCELPYMPYTSNTPTYIPKKNFIEYLDEYVSKFKISPNYCRSVKSASFDDVRKVWRIQALNTTSNKVEVYIAKFLVVATGENSEGLIPEISGLNIFDGKILHSNQYKSGLDYHDKKVLVVGSGNSGMEIAFDLANYGAITSVVVRSPIHVLSKEMVHLGMRILKYLPCYVVDALMVMLSKLVYGNLSQYGIPRPAEGPFHLKTTTGRSPIINVGTVEMIKAGKIKTFSAISSIDKKGAVFNNGEKAKFDAIIFATGYKSTVNNWLQDYDFLLNDEGMPKNKPPNHWKGENGLYCAGFGRGGLFQISLDAKAIAQDIKMVLTSNNKEKNA